MLWHLQTIVMSVMGNGLLFYSFRSVLEAEKVCGKGLVEFLCFMAYQPSYLFKAKAISEEE